MKRCRCSHKSQVELGESSPYIFVVAGGGVGSGREDVRCSLPRLPNIRQYFCRMLQNIKSVGYLIYRYE
jgi:hypothetical protein